MWWAWAKSSGLATLWLSVKIAGVAVFVMTPLAILAAYWLSFAGRAWSRACLSVIIRFSLVLPPIATGYCLLLLLGDDGILGKPLHQIFRIKLSFNFAAAVIAAAVASFPLFVQSIRVAMDNFDRGAIETATTLGARRGGLFFWIILPLSWPAILSGAILAFMRGLGEFGTTLMLAGNIEGETRTLSIAIWTALSKPDSQEPALYLFVLAFGLSIVTLVISELVVRNK